MGRLYFRFRSNLSKNFNFGVLHPYRCTDGGEIWHGGGDRRSPPPCQISPPSVRTRWVLKWRRGPNTLGVKMEEGTEGPLLHAKFHPHRCNVSPLRGENPQNWPLSKRNTGRFALCAMLPVTIPKRRHDQNHVNVLILRPHCVFRMHEAVHFKFGTQIYVRNYSLEENVWIIL